MTTHDQPIYDLIVEVRAAFNALKSYSDAMIEDLGVTSAMRAVLEFLFTEGPHPVPRIAEAKSVTRQHIQILADALSEKGLVRFAENPGHKRSKLLELTPTGEELFASIRTREAKVLERLSGRIPADQARQAAQVIRSMRQALAAAAASR
jgi:DNA-binding MarR family transcriptional regulator